MSNFWENGLKFLELTLGWYWISWEGAVVQWSEAQSGWRQEVPPQPHSCMRWLWLGLPNSSPCERGSTLSTLTASLSLSFSPFWLCAGSLMRGLWTSSLSYTHSLQGQLGLGTDKETLWSGGASSSVVS